MRPDPARSPSILAGAVLCLAASLVWPRSLGSEPRQVLTEFGPRLHGRLLELGDLGLARHEPHAVLEAQAGHGEESRRHLRVICRDLIDLPALGSLTLGGEAHAGQTLLAFFGRASDGVWLPEGCGHTQIGSIARALVRSDAYRAAKRRLETLVDVVVPAFLAGAPAPGDDAYDQWLASAERQTLRRDIVAADLSWVAIAVAASLPADREPDVFAQAVREIDALTALHAKLYELNRSTRSMNALPDGGTHLVALFLTGANVLPHSRAVSLRALARTAVRDISNRFSNARDIDVRASVLSHLIQLAGCQRGLASPWLIREWRSELADDALLASSSVAVLSHVWRAWAVKESLGPRGVCVLV